MTPEFIKELKDLISDDKLEKVISKLQNGGQWIPETAKEEILLLSGRLRDLRQQAITGVISEGNERVEKNKIRTSLLHLVHTYSKSPEEQARLKVKKKLKWIMPLAASLVAAGAVIWWLFQPQPTFRLEAELLVERVSFTYLEGPVNFAQGKMLSCYWQNYKTLEMEGERVLLDENSDKKWEKTYNPVSKVAIHADENVSGVGVRFGPAILERLHLEPHSTLTFSQPESPASVLQITIQQPNELRSDWTFQDSIDLQIEMATLEGLAESMTLYSPASLRVFPPEGKAREIKVRAFSGTSNLELEFDQGYEIEGKSLLISEPGFYQPLESVAVPTLLGGTIRMGDLDAAPLTTISISEGEALDLYGQSHFSLHKIHFGEKGIQIHFNGVVQKIETGRDHELRNPTRLEWLWHSQKLLVLAILVVMLGVAAFLVIQSRK